MKLRLVLLGALIATAALGQWETESRVTTNTSVLDATTTGNARAVAMRGDTVHVVYHEGSMFSSIIYYCRSIDRGSTWQARVQLSVGGTWNNAQFGCIAEPPVDAQLVKDEGHIDECLPIRLFSYSTLAQLQGATDSMSIRDLVSDL